MGRKSEEPNAVVTETPAAEEPKKKAAPEKKEDGFFIYLGPNIRGVIQNASIYPGSREEVEAFLAGAIEKYPRIKNLLISGETVAEQRSQVTTPGNYLYETYRKVVADVKMKEV